MATVCRRSPCPTCAAAPRCTTGPGLTPRAVGERGGNETGTLTRVELTAHRHGVNAAAAATSKTPVGLVPRFDVGGLSYGAAHGTTVADDMIGAPGQLAAAQQDRAALGDDYCIAIEGLCPSPRDE